MSARKIMVGLKGRSSVEELTDLACRLAAGTGAQLIALHAVQVPLATPLEANNQVIDQEGKEILSRAERIAASRVPAGFEAQLVRARNVGEATVREAEEQDVSLLVIGHHRQHEFSELLLGSTARHVVHHAPCRVIVQVPAPRAPKPQRLSESASDILAQSWAAYVGGVIP